VGADSSELGHLRTENYGVIVIRRSRPSISGGSIDVPLNEEPAVRSGAGVHQTEDRNAGRPTAIRVQVNGQYVRALIVRALKAPECLVFLSKPCIDDGDVVCAGAVCSRESSPSSLRQYRAALKLVVAADSLQLTARMPRKQIMRLEATMD
jgi:hypothetical protein